MSEILTIEGMKDSTAEKIMKYKAEGLEVEEISRKTRVGIEKIEKVIEANADTEPIRENELGNQTILEPETDNSELTIEKEIEIENTELHPDNIISEGVDSESKEIIKMQPKMPKAGKAKEKKNPKPDTRIISMSDLPGKGRKR